MKKKQRQKELEINWKKYKLELERKRKKKVDQTTYNEEVDQNENICSSSKTPTKN